MVFALRSRLRGGVCRWRLENTKDASDQICTSGFQKKFRFAQIFLGLDLRKALHKESAGNLMKRLGQRYVQYVNRSNNRSGTLWKGRFRSSVIQQDTCLLACQRYIEMNPVRAGMVNHPSEYKWSSYRINGQGESSGLVTPHSLYHDLGHDETERSSAYRELFRHELEPGEIDKIRKATNGNFALGSSRFQEEIGAMLERRVIPGRAGRPRKAGNEAK